jgi:hypothetical protein
MKHAQYLERKRQRKKKANRKRKKILEAQEEDGK